MRDRYIYILYGRPISDANRCVFVDGIGEAAMCVCLWCIAERTKPAGGRITDAVGTNDIEGFRRNTRTLYLITLSVCDVISYTCRTVLPLVARVGSVTRRIVPELRHLHWHSN